MHTIKFLFVLLAVTISTLTGCAGNPYKNFYKDAIGATNWQTNPIFIIANEPPMVIRTTNARDESIRLFENGFRQVGYSSFIGDLQGDQGAIEQAKSLSAAVVVVISKPITELPSSQFGQLRIEQAATYWVKSRSNVNLFGVNLQQVPDDVARINGSSKGMHVVAVDRRSPAFTADVLKNDVILSIDSVTTNDQASFATSIKDKTGKKVEVVLIRNGVQLTKVAILGQWN